MQRALTSDHSVRKETPNRSAHSWELPEPQMRRVIARKHGLPQSKRFPVCS